MCSLNLQQGGYCVTEKYSGALLEYISYYTLSSNVNHLIATLKPQSNGPLYSNTVIGTLAVWVGCYIWYSEEWPGRAVPPPSPLIAVPNVTAHPTTASVPTSYYLMWHSNCLWSLKG